jgi:hypothetical protein
VVPQPWLQNKPTAEQNENNKKEGWLCGCPFFVLGVLNLFQQSLNRQLVLNSSQIVLVGFCTINAQKSKENGFSRLGLRSKNLPFLTQLSSISFIHHKGVLVEFEFLFFVQ